MKKIKIFLASSIDELKGDRSEIGDYFRRLNDIYVDSDVYFQLIKCENYDKTISVNGKQTEYDREIEDSELCFFLFFRKVGDYTRHEFDVAMESFKSKRRPKVVTYFKYVNTPDEVEGDALSFMRLLDEEIHHYYNLYGHIDTLKLGMLMQIKLMKLDSSEITLRDGEVKLNGRCVVSTENIPMLSGNENLRTLTERKKELQEKLGDLREAFFNDPSEENEQAFSQTRNQLGLVSEELTRVERDAMNFVTTIAELTADGKVLTHRQKKALKYFHDGDYLRAQAVLEDEERKNELARAEAKVEIGKNEIMGYIEEDRLWIKAEMACGVTTESALLICEKYQVLRTLVEKYDLDKEVMYEYAGFLFDQGDFEKAIEISETLKWYYEKPSAQIDDALYARLLNLLGILYYEVKRLDEAERALMSARALRQRLYDENAVMYEYDLSVTEHNLGLLYRQTGQLSEAERCYATATAILTALCSRSPGGYAVDLARHRVSLGSLYCEQGRYSEAEAVLRENLEFIQNDNENDKDIFLPILGVLYSNLGAVYNKLERFDEAEDALTRALDINWKTYQQNHEAHERDLAKCQMNLANLYLRTDRYDDAVRCYLSAIEIWCRLRDKDPAPHEVDLALCYNNLGILYMKQRRYEDSERTHLSALDIRNRLVENVSAAFEIDLATSYHNLGILYKELQRYEDSEQVTLMALEIRERLEKNNPQSMALPLATTNCNLGILYQTINCLDRSRKHYLAGLEIFESFKDTNPALYQINLKNIEKIREIIAYYDSL